MKPIVICYPSKLAHETEAINALFSAGLQVLHLRKPTFKETDMVTFIDAIDAAYHKNIVMHSHLSIVERKGLKGVHFTSYNRHLIDDYSHKSLPKSITVHSMSELINLSAAFSYALLSPVFESISKEGYGPTIDHEVLKKYLTHEHEVPVLALGGIDHKNVETARKMGFDGVALHGYLWAQFEKDHDIKTLVERYTMVAEKWQ
ncbi:MULTISPECIES: thiamine phosphate synthase [unclassified Carboxylicivirga]|uniref:thiamine phosphate synthase n=1 Tax=Carboxylicivirga TaxID=1628153 RepID=UPI003D339702